MPDENGITRRGRNEKFGEVSPELDFPDIGIDFWSYYWTISSTLRRVEDGVAIPIPPSEFLAWCEASGTILTPPEYAILSGMDDAFCDEMNRELKDFRTRQEEAQKAAAEAAKRKRR